MSSIAILAVTIVCLPLTVSASMPKTSDAKPLAPSIEERKTEGYTHVPIKEHSKTLELREVLKSVSQHYPSILAAKAEFESSKGNALSQEGQFDLLLKANYLARPEGKDQNRRLEAGAELPTKVWGTNLFAAYNMSAGQFPVYEGQYDKVQDGAYKAGIEIPLLQNGSIDKRRTSLTVSDLQMKQSEKRLDFAQIEILRAATKKYWDWAAAGLRLAIIDGLVKIAEDRDRQLERRYRAGDLPEIEWRDNQRAIWQRRGQLVLGERLYRRAALELSLYFRSGTGEPIVPTSDALPTNIVPTEGLALTDEKALMDEGLRARPDLAELEQQIKETEAELRLSDNQILPKLDLKLGVERDARFRDNATASGATVGVGFELPLQRRMARGKVELYSAKRTALEAKNKLLKESVRVQVADSLVLIKATLENLKNVKEEVVLAKRVEEGERKRFQNGDSNLLAVNLREQATADAMIREIDALTQSQQARADLDAALGRIPQVLSSN